MGRSGPGAGELLKIIAQNFDVLAGPVVGLAYPLYASIRAIETKSLTDDRQWLTYWVLYSMITLFELTFSQLIEWIPFWSYIKLIITCWLVIPQFSGATYVYEHYVRPFYMGNQNINIWYVPRTKDVSSKHDDVIVSANKYVHGYGPDAYHEVIQQEWPDAFQETVQQSDREIRYGPYGGSTFFSEDDYVY